ncbi:MAG: pilus assembly protein TadG-related protein, partial [Salaquimonas sp.]
MFKRFIENENGNFAIIMGLMLVPLMGLLGAGFDYSQMTNEKVKIQKAADTALLAAARDARDSTQFYRLAENYFNANYHGGEVEYYAKADPDNVSLTIKSDYQTSMMG